MKPSERTRQELKIQELKIQELKIQEQKIDEALEETFPASDTPSFVGAGAGPDKKPAEMQAHSHEGQVRKRVV